MRYGASLASVSDLSWVAYLSYLAAHALANLDGILWESKRGNKDLCSGRDSKTVGISGVLREAEVVETNLRDVSEIRWRARRSLRFSFMVVAGKVSDLDTVHSRKRSRSTGHCSPKAEMNILITTTTNGHCCGGL